MTEVLATRRETDLLRAMVRQLLAGSSLAPGAHIARGTNTTGQALLLPGCNSLERSTYPAFWTRDPAWLAAGGLAAAADIWGWLQLLAATMQGDQARYLASGGVIPAFAIADHINLDGRPVYFPGTYDAGETQGPPWGKYPPHDDQYWPTFTAHAYATVSGDRRVGSRLIQTVLGEMPVWQVCDLAHHALPVDPATSLCLASENPDEHIVDWGYCDAVTKSGALLFPSLLRLESCLKLAALLTDCGEERRATGLRAEAAGLRAAIALTFLTSYRQQGREDLWLVSATGLGRKPDVWGTAFAVHRGYVDDALAETLARSLLQAFREGAAVQQGQVCHIPRPFGFWERAQCKPGEYQNGAYWGYPAGWYIHALWRVDRTAARDLLTEYIQALTASWDDQCLNCAYECINPELNYRRNPGYLTTVALPYVALLEAGLLPGSDGDGEGHTENGERA